jgi:hypothetical protein
LFTTIYMCFWKRKKITSFDPDLLRQLILTGAAYVNIIIRCRRWGISLDTIHWLTHVQPGDPPNDPSLSSHSHTSVNFGSSNNRGGSIDPLTQSQSLATPSSSSRNGMIARSRARTATPLPVRFSLVTRQFHASSSCTVRRHRSPSIHLDLLPGVPTEDSDGSINNLLPAVSHPSPSPSSLPSPFVWSSRAAAHAPITATEEAHMLALGIASSFPFAVLCSCNPSLPRWSLCLFPFQPSKTLYLLTPIFTDALRLRPVLTRQQLGHGHSLLSVSLLQ